MSNTNHTHKIVGMDYYQTLADDMDEMLSTFVTKLRQRPIFKNSWIIYIGERNTGHESGRHAQLLEKMRKTYSLKDKPDRNYGVWTSQERKKAYGNDLREMLKDKRFVLMKNFVVVFGDDAASEKLRRKDVQAELIGSMLRAKYVTSGKNKKKIIGWSAKMDDDRKFDESMNDDLLVALAMTIYFSARFMKRTLPFYVNYNILH